MNRNAVLIVTLAFLSNLAVVSSAWPSGREVVEIKARPFVLHDVRLLDGPFKDAMERTQKYLHALESERFLYFFRETAKLDAPGEPMGGWETREVRGHSLGHYLSACAMMFASTGDEKLKVKANLIVAELTKCQQVHGNGYLSAFPESLIDRCLAQKPAWAPWYTLHKILAGLIDMYMYCGNDEALSTAIEMAKWAELRWNEFGPDELQQILNKTEQGGFNEALANLYGLTGDRRWLNLSRKLVQNRYVVPLAHREDRLKGEHVNSFIPNIIGTARQYELSGDKRDHDIATFFWDQVVTARSYCTGGTSEREHWQSDPFKLAGQLSDHTQETCCTYNMLKLTRHLYSWDPKVKYADYYERALFNSILSTQDPDTGMMMYFVTLASGRWKYFNTPRDSFWCCTGTGMENHAKYGEYIYQHDRTGIWVNLFIASEVHWQEKGATIRQETSFPDEPQTVLTVNVDVPTVFTLRLRIPGWTRNPEVRVNGERPAQQPVAGSYLDIKRMWTKGDIVTLNMPMEIRAWPMPDDPTLLAIMYGPLVLAGQLGDEGLTKELVYTTRNWFAFPKEHIVQAPTLVTDNADPAAWVRPVANERLTFSTVGVGRPRDVRLVPYHRLWAQRYAVYWRVIPEARWKVLEMERAAREAAEIARTKMLARRRIDHVQIGDEKSEAAHDLQSERSTAGDFGSRRWRHAMAGWFSYRLKVLPETKTAVLCTYWGSDAGRRTFDILIDDTKIATQTLNQNRPNEFFDVEYPIPPEITRGKSSVTITFRAHNDHTAGGLFGLSTLRETKTK